MRGQLVTVFGGDGFVGRYVVQALLASGARVRVAVRRPSQALWLKPLGNLGQTQIVYADLLKPDSVAAAVAGADAVINLVGIFGSASAMDRINRGGADRVAREAKAAGVTALVHFSAIGADSQSRSAYGRSKGAGETAVARAFPGATIVRPSIIFGREDNFVNRFARLIRMAPFVPVIGADTRFQPVYVADVARAVASILTRKVARGETLELGGPQIVSMLELNQWIAKAIGRDRAFFSIPDFVAGPMAAMTGWLPGAPINSDQFKMLQNDNVVSGADGLAVLDIAPMSLDSVAHDWLTLYRKHGRFGDQATA